MKSLVRALLLTATLASLPVNHVQAQDEEAAVSDALIEGENTPKKKDNLEPISGTIPLSDVPHYDLYERQLRYKPADKAYKDSIEARRYSFIKPESEHYNNYQKNLVKAYSKESEQSLKEKPSPKIFDDEDLGIDEEEKSVKVAPEDNRPVVPVGEPGDGMDQAPEDIQKQASVTEEQEKPSESQPSKTAADENVGIKEIDVEDTKLDDEARKKIVVPEDAPNFDKSPF